MSATDPAATATPPEPGLTQEAMIERAIAMRPELIADQAQTEQRTFYSPEMHQRFLDAGFYHLYVPRRYGGYEFDVPTYMRVVQEIARGCVSTAWCAGLTMNHALMVGSWWPQEAQDAIFAGGDFRASSVAAPVGPAVPTEEGWRIDGQVAYASGTPYSTFYMGQALLPNEEQRNPPPLAPVRGASQPMADARRLGRDHRPEGLGLAQHPIRGDGDPRLLGLRGQHDRHRRGRRHAGLAAARQPHVLGPCDVHLHDVTRGGRGRRRLQRA